MDSTFEVAWMPLGQVDRRELKDARLQTHWAVQTLATIGNHLVPFQADYGHTALVWLDDALATRTVTTNGRTFRAALRIAALEVSLLDRDGRSIDRFPLGGRTLLEALEWLSIAVTDYTNAPPQVPLALVGYTMESHPVKDGARFDASVEHLAELERWFKNGAGLFEAVRNGTTGASEVRIWPHHFDIASLVTFDGPEVEAETARSIGFGLSPGDQTYPEPYWYVLPWPPPPTERLTALDAGAWHTEGFVAAVLTGAHDLPVVERFLRAANRQARSAIGVG